MTLAGAAAERAALNKHAKYEHFKNNYIFIPLTCEVMGSADSIAFFDGLAEKIHSITGDKREREINCTRDFLLRSKEEMLPAFNAVFSDGCFDADVLV